MDRDLRGQADGIHHLQPKSGHRPGAFQDKREPHGPGLHPGPLQRHQERRWLIRLQRGRQRSAQIRRRAVRQGHSLFRSRSRWTAANSEETRRPHRQQSQKKHGREHCIGTKKTSRLRGCIPTIASSCITVDREGDTLDLEADHRRHAGIENAVRDLKYGLGLNHLPSGRFPANAAWLAVQVMAHNLARWTTRIGLGEPVATTRTLRRRFCSLAGRIPASPAGSPCIYPTAGPGRTGSPAPWLDSASCRFRPDHVRAFCSSAEIPNCLADPRQAAGRCRSLTAVCMPIAPVADAATGQIFPSRRRHAQRPHQSVGVSALLPATHAPQPRVACPRVPLRWIGAWAVPACRRSVDARRVRNGCAIADRIRHPTMSKR